MCEWEVLPNLHVVPLDDYRDHVGLPNCWCGPVEDDEVWMHNAMDQREKYETGELRPH